MNLYALHSLGIRREPAIVLPVNNDADRGGRWAARCEACDMCDGWLQLRYRRATRTGFRSQLSCLACEDLCNDVGEMVAAGRRNSANGQTVALQLTAAGSEEMMGCDPARRMGDGRREERRGRLR